MGNSTVRRQGLHRGFSVCCSMGNSTVRRQGLHRGFSVCCSVGNSTVRRQGLHRRFSVCCSVGNSTVRRQGLHRGFSVGIFRIVIERYVNRVRAIMWICFIVISSVFKLYSRCSDILDI